MRLSFTTSFWLQTTFVTKLVVVANDKLYVKTNCMRQMKYFFIKYLYGGHIVYTWMILRLKLQLFWWPIVFCHMVPTWPTPHGTYITYMGHKFKHKPCGTCLNLGAMWHLVYLGLHICHVASRCRHMPCATFRLGLDFGCMAHRLG